MLAEATGVAPGDVERVPLTREQYNRALEYIRRWPSRTYAHHQPEPSPSRRREELPEQTALPLEQSAQGVLPAGGMGLALAGDGRMCGMATSVCTLGPGCTAPA